MQRNFFNIVLFFVVGAIGIPNLSQAQEGEVIEEKSENSETIRKDSLPILSESPEDGSRENYDVMPVGPMPDFNLTRVPLVEPNFDKEEKKINNGVNDKLKSGETQANHSFNFIYYLFYKFKLAGSTDD